MTTTDDTMCTDETVEVESATATVVTANSARQHGNLCVKIVVQLSRNSYFAVTTFLNLACVLQWFLQFAFCS